MSSNGVNPEFTGGVSPDNPKEKTYLNWIKHLLKIHANLVMEASILTAFISLNESSTSTSLAGGQTGEAVLNDAIKNASNYANDQEHRLSAIGLGAARVGMQTYWDLDPKTDMNENERHDDAAVILHLDATSKELSMKPGSKLSVSGQFLFKAWWEIRLTGLEIHITNMLTKIPLCGLTLAEHNHHFYTD